MTMYVCTATFHQGEVRSSVTGTGATLAQAFHDAVRNQPVGFRPNGQNEAGASRMLYLWKPGILTDQKAHAYLTSDGVDDLPTIEVGWVRYTFEEQRTPRLWAVTAQVEVSLSSGYTSSRQVPTFYLDPQVQMILTADGARKVAEDILSTAGPVDDQEVTLHVTVEPVY